MRGWLKGMAFVGALGMVMAGCSIGSTTTKRSEADESLAQLTQYLDTGHPKAALGVANQLVAAQPENYEHYLTRNTVYLALRDFPAAMQDNEAALKAFEVNPAAYTQQERPARLASIHESFAITALLAAKDEKDVAKRKEWAKIYEEHAARVKELDVETYRHLRGLQGESVE